jgi:hypothetical protein
MSARAVSLMLFLFTALTITHAAFVNYRSGAAEIQPQVRTDAGKILLTNQTMYLQTRKLGVPQLAAEYFRDSDNRTFWRGTTRSRWTESGLCCGVFDLLIKMKGGKTRVIILKSLAEPKNKLQLANELGIDWKAVDAHIKKLLYYGLVFETTIVGTCRLYSISEKGKAAVELVDRSMSTSPDCL